MKIFTYMYMVVKTHDYGFMKEGLNACTGTLPPSVASVSKHLSLKILSWNMIYAPGTSTVMLVDSELNKSMKLEFSRAHTPRMH